MKKDGKEIIHVRKSINIKKIKRKNRDVHVLNQFRNINRKRKREIVRIRSKDITNMTDKGKMILKEKESSNKGKLDPRLSLYKWAKFIKERFQKLASWVVMFIFSMYKTNFQLLCILHMLDSSLQMTLLK